MLQTIHLGFTCGSCHTRVPVYSFTRSRTGASQACTPPTDQHVLCPKCCLPRYVKFADIQNLERWEEKGAA